MMGPGLRVRVFAACIVASVLVAGCFGGLDDRAEFSDENQGQGLEFSWSQSPDEIHRVYRLVIETGPETTCIREGSSWYQGSSPTGLSAYYYYRYANVTGFDWGIAVLDLGPLVRSAVHVGPVNTGQYLWQDPFVSAGGNGSRETGPDWYHESIIAVFAQGEASFEIECDSRDARIRFYEPDDYTAIYSPYATGGVGAHVAGPLPVAEVNHGDSWTIETEGRHVHMHAFSSPDPLSPVPIQAGHVIVSTPSGEELSETGGSDRLGIWGLYDEPGEYGIYMERSTIGYTPLMGFLAGFRLVYEDGDLQESILERVE